MRNAERRGRVIAAALVVLGATAPGPVRAQAPGGPPAAGFSGFVTLLGGYVSVKSQFVTDGENRETSSLNGSGQTIDSFVVAPLFEFAYAIGDWRTQLYLGLALENIREGTFFQQEIGVRHWLADGTRLTAAFLPWPVIAQKTWQDPFVTGEGRERTDVDAFGVKLDADRIARTNVGLRYRFVSRSIDKEDSGEFLRDLPGSTLTDDVRNLRRGADSHQATVSYTWPIARGLLLRPALRYTYADADVGANSFQAVRPEVGVLFRTPGYDASLNLSYERSWFNRDNPIYGEKRDGNDYGAVLLSATASRLASATSAPNSSAPPTSPTRRSTSTTPGCCSSAPARPTRSDPTRPGAAAATAGTVPPPSCAAGTSPAATMLLEYERLQSTSG